MIAVLLSGTGRSLLNLIDQGFKNKIAFVASQKENAAGLQIARDNKIPIFRLWEYLAKSAVLQNTAFDQGVELIVLAGYTAKIDVSAAYTNKIINIHPSLLPAFGGKGMYGYNVHEAVYKSGVKFSGCTVHYVNNEYDNGPIILQRLVPVFDDDKLPDLANRVFEEEKIALPLAITKHLEGKLKVEGNRVLWDE